MRRYIGGRLKDARLQAELTQEDVATDFLRSRQAVSSWENGKTLPTLLEFRELLTLYGVSGDRILFGAEDFEGQTGEVLARVGKISHTPKERHDGFEPSAFGQD